MAAAKACKEESVLEVYADEKYKKLLKDGSQYISLDDYCTKRGIE